MIGPPQKPSPFRPGDMVRFKDDQKYYSGVYPVVTKEEWEAEHPERKGTADENYWCFIRRDQEPTPHQINGWWWDLFEKAEDFTLDEIHQAMKEINS